MQTAPLRTGFAIGQAVFRCTMILCALAIQEALTENPPTIVPPEARVSDTEVRRALADNEAAMGHAASCRDSYRLLLETSRDDWQLRLAYADCCILWGDFYAAEKTYLEYLRQFPEAWDIQVKLAKTLAASQQFERAEGLYLRLLMIKPTDAELQLGLANTRFEEHNFPGALRILNNILAGDRNNADAIAMKGRVFLQLKQWHDAVSAYEFLSTAPGREVEALVGIGRGCFAQGKAREAEAAFSKAIEIAPRDVDARFHDAGPDKVKTDSFLSGVLADADAPELVKWAQLYQARQLRRQAIQCWQKAIDMDRDFFPARIGLAQALALDRQFDRALAMYGQLALDFPGSFKILIEQARALAWDRKYDESMDLYGRIAALNTDSVVPVRETARVAAWAKKMDKTREIYARLLDPPVDSRLCLIIQDLAAASNSEALLDIVGQLRARVEPGTPYDAYEMLFDETDSRTRDLPADLRDKLVLIRLNLLPVYRTQKAAFLESSGKQMAWHKRFFQALKPYRELVEFDPGNEEARYDLSQVEFALGMDREAVYTTEQLLDLDPFHSQAPLVQQTMDTRDNPYAAPGYTYWHEEGRGDLVDIARHRYDAAAGAPLFGRAYLQAAAHLWQECPGNRWGSFNAEGFSLQGGGVAAAWLSADGGITFKDYESSGIENAISAHAEASVNIHDILTLGLRMERMDELYNGFCIEQGIQSDSLVLSGRSFLTRDLELNAFGKLSDYSDDNSGEQAYLNIAYSATDHPRILKAAVFGEVRDTDKMTLYEYDADVLINIEHPYWTPENYASWGIIVEWYDDRSPVFSRGTDSRFYDMSVTLRDDTESNRAVELRGKLHWEWWMRWVLGLEATLVRSREWDAEGLWLTLKRHF